MNKPYKLEDRTFLFAKDCRDFVRNSAKTTANLEYSKQLARSSGSVAANYIEANEALSKKDFILRIKICRKEAKESVLWLKLLESSDGLVNEAMELTKIFGSILEKSKER